mmetsp:Transcript_1516/g.5564  ORF Transcript_1516/g.5564 Transcript_1516/m.5564 type:complete len:230 (-) Transcript_1516:5-694(-)
MRRAGRPGASSQPGGAWRCGVARRERRGPRRSRRAHGSPDGPTHPRAPALAGPERCDAALLGNLLVLPPRRCRARPPPEAVADCRRARRRGQLVCERAALTTGASSESRNDRASSGSSSCYGPRRRRPFSPASSTAASVPLRPQSRDDGAAGATLQHFSRQNGATASHHPAPAVFDYTRLKSGASQEPSGIRGPDTRKTVSSREQGPESPSHATKDAVECIIEEEDALQ